jgi:ATP phosphoribosyltransferase regulatory subunit
MENIIDLKRIRYDEKLAFSLRGIYEGYGYLPYNMSKFEEYELYSKNKDFLGDGGILTFTDVNGRLMALKPDVTLSIVKNSVGSEGMQKVYYKENVYRTNKKGGGFKEITQCGIECIGDVGKYEVIEVLLLALESLKATDRPNKLVISHMGILSALISNSGLSDSEVPELITCIKRKNTDGIAEIGARNGVDLTALADAVALNGKPNEIISSLRSICPDVAESIDVLENITNELTKLGYIDNISIDLSVMNDMNYYRSLVFRGYVDCIPESVLIGGRYDQVLKKMGRKCGAIGFAVALDKLKELSRNDDPTYRDVLIVYSENTSPSDVINAISQVREKGMSVVALPYNDETKSFGQVFYMNDDGKITEEGDYVNA